MEKINFPLPTRSLESNAIGQNLRGWHTVYKGNGGINTETNFLNFYFIFITTRLKHNKEGQILNLE